MKDFVEDFLLMIMKEMCIAGRSVILKQQVFLSCSDMMLIHWSEGKDDEV